MSTIAIILIVLYLLSSIKILREYERGVIFRLGRLLAQPKGPGLVLVFAPLDRIVRVSLRIDTLEVPAQDVVTRDNVTVKVNAVMYFRVLDPSLAVVEVSNFLYATSQLAQTTLRSVLGEVELDELLSQREKLNVRLQSILDQHTSTWGVKVTMVEVKQVDLAEQMIRAIARQAEAERERRAKIIHAEGEYTASEKLAMMHGQFVRSPGAIAEEVCHQRRMGAQAAAIGFGGKQIFDGACDLKERIGAVLVETTVQQQDGFLCPGRTKSAKEKDRAEGREDMDDLLAIGENHGAADEDLPEGRVEARGRNKLEPDAELVLTDDRGLKGNPQLRDQLRGAFHLELEGEELVNWEGLLNAQEDAAGTDVFDGGRRGGNINPIEGREPGYGPSVRPLYLRFA